MTPDKLNAKLVEAMKSKLPEGTVLANVLADILPIGKEAIYRRFRGEVAFTFPEVMTIAKELGISLDELNGFTNNKESLVNINLYQSGDLTDIYYATIEQYIDIFKRIQNTEHNIELWRAANRLSHVFCMNFDSLSRFHLFKWLYQHESNVGKKSFSLEDIQISEKVRTKEREFFKVSRGFKQNNFIWDNMLFKSLVNDILYFKQIDLISAESLQAIKSDLLEVINGLEELAARGRFLNGNEVQIFISHINLETSYSYIESENQKISLIRIYDLNVVTSYNPDIFNNLKGWIHSLKNFSVLISQSAEIQRYKFFQEQREYVNSL